MDKELSVSVIIPIYNTPSDMLDECFKSLSEQTHCDFEVVAVDDGSEESTARHLDMLAEGYRGRMSITVIHKENGGVSSARNIGIENAKCSYIAFLDADDTYDPHFLEYMTSAIEQTGERIASCGITSSDNLAQGELSFSHLHGTQVWQNDNIGSVGNHMFDRELLGEHRFDTEIVMCEDWYFMNRVLMTHPSLVKVELNLYYYRINPNSCARNLNMKKYRDAAFVIDYIIDNVPYVYEDNTLYMQHLADGASWHVKYMSALTCSELDNRKELFQATRQMYIEKYVPKIPEIRKSGIGVSRFVTLTRGIIKRSGALSWALLSLCFRLRTLKRRLSGKSA